MTVYQCSTGDCPTFATEGEPKYCPFCKHRGVEEYDFEPKSGKV